MKRSQIRRHQITWFLMVPILIAIIAGALMVRPNPADLQQTLPEILTR